MAWCTNELDTPCTPKEARTKVSQMLLAARNECEPPATVAAVPLRRRSLVVVRLRLLASKHLRRASFHPVERAARTSSASTPGMGLSVSRLTHASLDDEYQRMTRESFSSCSTFWVHLLYTSAQARALSASRFNAACVLPSRRNSSRYCISTTRIVVMLRFGSPFSSWFAHLRVPLRTPTVRRLVRPFSVSCLLRACLACRVWRVLSARLLSIRTHAFQLSQSRSKRGTCHLVRCGEGLRCACSKPPAPRPSRDAPPPPPRRTRTRAFEETWTT